jgi:hypothetical protein
MMKSLTLSAAAFSDVSNQSDTHWVFTPSESVFNELNVRLDIAVKVLTESAGLELGIIALSNFCSCHQYRDEQTP